MKTEVIQTDPESPDSDVIQRAANLLRSGELIAFPTETVYGLGANALDVDAVKSIFRAKGRPADNPLIVHTATVEQAKRLAEAWPVTADRVATQFWPGPLTLVLRKTAAVPYVVTAGAPTVALRVPAHPIALALIEAAEIPIAAPSANRSNRLSPTQAKHVYQDLQGEIPLILDGGPTSGGLESTVVDFTRDPPCVLRPGLISLQQLREIVGDVDEMGANEKSIRSPGRAHRHYAPRTVMECWLKGGVERAIKLLHKGDRVAWVFFRERPTSTFAGVIAQMPDRPQEYAARLYAILHELDEQRLDRILVELPPDSDEWRAVRDRLRRAAELFHDE